MAPDIEAAIKLLVEGKVKLIFPFYFSFQFKRITICHSNV